jgi:hypothetical protein
MRAATTKALVNHNNNCSKPGVAGSQRSPGGIFESHFESHGSRQ